MSLNVNSSYSAFYHFKTKPDPEHQRIIDILWQKYGVRSSGSKSLDKAKLHELELKDAKKENDVTNKFLTVTKKEQEKIQENKKANQDKEQLSEPIDAAKIYGEQIFLAINMKQKEENYDNIKKRNNKYQI